jgi:hypothetical protein
LRDIESHPFLADALIGNPAPVMPTMARIDHNGALGGSQGSHGQETAGRDGKKETMTIHFRR